MIASFFLCSAVTLYSEVTQYAATLMPKGSCNYCCPIKEREDIAFFLYTRHNREHPQRLYMDSHFELYNSFLNKNYTTVIYIHGFSELKESKSTKTVRDALLDNGKYNFIIVDWHSLSAVPWYKNAVINVKTVGMYTALFLKFLLSHGVPLKSVHVIGFSLGAEVAGFIGKYMDKKLPRITGLDPAFPLYSYNNKAGHLTSTDAEFVDVIHTDGGVFGFKQPLGHADFYPNGGKPLQPGCTYKELSVKKNLKDYMACSHHRAWALFSESLKNPKAFPATKCESYFKFKKNDCYSTYQTGQQFMGMFAEKSLRGNFYLNTNAEPPYGLGY